MNNLLNVNVALNNSALVVRNPYTIAVQTAINALLTICAVVGNSLVCLAFYRNPSVRTVTNYFVLSLAIADLLVAVLVLPVHTASITTASWITGEMGCKVNFYLVQLLGGTSLLTLMLVAINRDIRVVRPALYLKVFFKTSGIAMAISAWVLPGLITLAMHILIIRSGGSQIFHVYPASCFEPFTAEEDQRWKLQGLVAFGYIAVVTVVIITCYVKIHNKIRHHNAAAAPSSQGGHSAYGVQEAAITKMLCLVVAGFYLCWLPLIVYKIVGMLIDIEEETLYYRDFINYLIIVTFLSCAINPMLYTLFSQAFRKEFIRIFLFQRTS